jgi:hypothetical protein
MLKYIKQIDFVANYRNPAEGQGSWREDHQFYSPEAASKEHEVKCEHYYSDR